MAWSKFLLTGLKSAVWHHLAISGLILVAMALSDAGCCLLGGCSRLLVCLKCHMHDVFDHFTSNNVRPYLTKLR